ncbi:urea transporter [Paraburkholderia tropica]|uniref:urea transporter n=1 Tax=Paraburkholderia tropica TaxID=92647 RepID=UPI001603A936|nr:urea transporter [Paraburkholderia tropica]QNB13659.1 urea transporter [Paraburkholderia tropica]
MLTSAPAPAHPDAASARLAAPLHTLLRSLGQIVLQRHAGTGACVLAALALCDARLVCAALIGATAANVCALLGGAPLVEIDDGLAGFNGALAALAAFTFADDPATAVALALLAACASAWLGAPLARRLGDVGLAVYSSPCLIATWVWMALRTAAPPNISGISDAKTAHAPQAFDLAAHALSGTFSGLAQTAFASGALPGLVLLAGIALSSRRAAAFALGGAALASGIEWLAGVPGANFDAGLCGFNGALAALAAGTLGARAAICATMLAAALHLVATCLGLPAMTAPFALAGWAVHGAWRLCGFTRAAPVSPAAIRLNDRLNDRPYDR